MSLAILLANVDWDRPFFKKLARNDTGEAPGHQGGMVIPKDLRKFFPGLLGITSALQPTLDQRITAELFVEDTFLGLANTRYQYQTWGGERSPESRLTDELGPLRNRAKGGDYLLIQRSIDNLSYYRLILVRQVSKDYGAISGLTGTRNWGPLTGELPLSDPELRAAETAERARENAPFQLFDLTSVKVEITSMRTARSVAFRQTIQRVYQETCCVCGSALKSPAGLLELDAAHVVPRGKAGADDARNGLALCKRHHWAFDRGLFGIDTKRKVYVPARVQGMPQNKPVADLHGSSIQEASEILLRANDAALDWHFNNVLVR